MLSFKSYFYTLLHQYLAFYIRPGDSMVEIYPQSSQLHQMFPEHTTTIVTKQAMAEKTAGKVLTDLQEIRAVRPDYLVLHGNIHYERDIQQFLEQLHTVCEPTTRLIFLYYSSLWKPMFKAANRLGLRTQTPEQNWIAHSDIDNLLLLSGFEPVRRDQRILFPLYIPILSQLLNRYLAPLPFFRLFTMLNVMIARPIIPEQFPVKPSVSVVVPARNEAGNIEQVITRLPKMGTAGELIFVEGHSTDDTWQTIQAMATKYAETMPIKIAKQGGKGKGDAVRKGFGLASNDILMILDADLTVPPEELPKFYQALVSGKGEFINGSRLVYPMEARAMRFLNLVGNKFFAVAFSFVLGQQFKDTLCGTKVLTKTSYAKIAANRSYFGDFDPFGDFDLLFGASRLGLKIVEIPITYKERTYGATNIQRWRHGLLLLEMLVFAARKIKFL
ncbi:glycosyltransferase family 2 protein [candidate division KSB1 bacterium]|nr:glycosyltransferase family 2 protein [candidate division KSB1 bacterium]